MNGHYPQLQAAVTSLLCSKIQHLHPKYGAGYFQMVLLVVLLGRSAWKKCLDQDSELSTSYDFHSFLLTVLTCLLLLLFLLLQFVVYIIFIFIQYFSVLLSRA